LLPLLAGGAAVEPTAVLARQSASAETTEAADFAHAIDARRADLIEIRRDIHRHPEPSGSEDRTAGIVAGVLRDAGFEVTTGVGGHGVVGVLRGGAPAAESGPVLAFRADMDAVRGTADDPMDFRSVVAGVNHNCGHDIHTSVGLALAVGFGAVRDELPGTVMLIFQPAEETASGARAMLADGVFDDPPAAVFAYHTAPLPVGEIMTRPGPLLAGRDRVSVTVRGDGDLTGAVRSVRAALADLATPGSEQPSLPAGASFVAVRGLQTTPRGAGEWDARATLTVSDSATSRAARERIEETLTELRRQRPGIELTLDYQTRWIAGLLNDPALVERANAVARGVLGDDAVRAPRTASTIFSEDFGSFQEKVPGVMYFLGVSNEAKGWVGMPHTPGYVADEDAIFVGAEVMAAVFMDLFEQGVPGT
jgi:metal-dependent amidase/aminoacylase/carboxypeptidase family protein